MTLAPELSFPSEAFSELPADHIQEEVRTLITENLMSLWLPPDQELRLGLDLARPSPSETGSGVKDWVNFSDRMGFIADLFRAYIDDRNLYSSSGLQRANTA